MSNSSKVRELLPRPTTVDELMVVVKKAIEGGGVSKLVIDGDKPHIMVERAAKESEGGISIERALYDAVRSASMEEYVPDGQKDPFRQLNEMFAMVQLEGLEVSFILSGQRQTFQDWLKVRFPKTQAAKIFGIGVHFVTDMPNDAVIVCGSPVRESDPSDVRFSVKGSTS